MQLKTKKMYFSISPQTLKRMDSQQKKIAQRKLKQHNSTVNLQNSPQHQHQHQLKFKVVK